MRISAKGRYALAAMTHMAGQHNGDGCVTVISISTKLGISKIYLEQVFSLLRRAGLVRSVKGSQGGYQLERMPQQITVYDVLSAVELSLFEDTEDTVRQAAPDIEAALRLSAFEPLEKAVQETLRAITLDDLAQQARNHQNGQSFMFYI